MSKTKYKHLEEVRGMIEACYRCGDCRTQVRPAVGRYQVCPVYETLPGKWEPFFARGKIMLANGLLQGQIEPSQNLVDMIFQCMICGSCKSSCNVSYHPTLPHPLSQLMDQPKIWEALRADLHEAGFAIPRHTEILECCATNYNPYFELPANRTNGIPPDKTFPQEADYLLFMGCTEAYRIPDILQKIIKILDKANVNYTILGTEEWCCGSIALRAGDRTLAQKLAIHNVEEIKKRKVTQIITHCAGCYRTLKLDYPSLVPEFNLKVLHITELIQDLLQKGELKFTNEVHRKVTYHDPCHLGRHLKVYEAPRYILTQMPGLEFIEMTRIKENAWCCGAGGGVKSAFPDLATQIAKGRIQEALELGVDGIITACPFCLRNLQDAAKDLNPTQPLEVIDLLDLVTSALGD